MNSTVIQVDSLTYAYPDGTAALNGVDFRVPAGQKLALAGPNGAGKSTLLLTLAGVLHDGFQGSVRVFDTPLCKANVRAIQRRLALVFQNPDDQLFCPTIFDDVAFGPQNLKLPHDEIDRRVESALAAVGLPGFARRSSFHLSLGEKKRAAIASVLSMQPEILALDEPTSMLDPRGRRELTSLLAAIGGTQIIVSHDLELISALCDRMLVLSHGRLVADGPPSTLLSDRALLEQHGLI